MERVLAYVGSWRLFGMTAGGAESERLPWDGLLRHEG